MKKNMFMRLAMALVLLVLVTTSAVGGTYAKYTTAADDNDTARVAKFGVVVDIKIAGAFLNQYELDGTYTDANGDEITRAAVSATTENILAPGTEGILLDHATITGEPEVAVKVTKVADLALVGWEVDGSYYCPLKITIGSDTLYGLDYASAADYEAAVEAKLNKTLYYQPNTDLAFATNASWEWDFVSVNGSEVEASDVKDTKLGDAGAATIEFSYSITVEQVE